MKYHTSQSGFSLVEVLVAISILLLVIVGPMGIISRANNSTAYSTEQVTAFFLAQEGLELAQKARDDRVLGDFDDQIEDDSDYPDPWSSFISSYGQCFDHIDTAGCGLYVTHASSTAAPVMVDCSTIANCLIVENTTAANVRTKLTHPHTAVTSSVPTPFTRVITMERVLLGGKVQEVKVTSTVTWRTGTLVAGQQVQLVTYLMNTYDTQ